MRRERRRYYAVMLMLIFVCGIVLTACQGGLTGGEKGQNQEVQKEFFAMDTYIALWRKGWGDFERCGSKDP